MTFLSGYYLLLTYLVASVPTGKAVATLFADTDITLHGSGNIGATNVTRVLGWRYGAITLAGDLGKGLLLTAVASSVDPRPWYPPVVAVLCFVGHCWSAYLEFRGGKGVATAAGALLALSPWAVLVTGAVWAAAYAAWRKASAASLLGAAVLPLAVAWRDPWLTPLAVLLAVGVVLRHRDNIGRLLAGNEP